MIARFAQQNALLLRTTDICVGTEKKTPREQNRSGKKIGAVWCSGADRRSFEASAVLHFVFFEVIVNKMQQSANENIVSVTYDLLGRRVALESKDTGRKEWHYDSKGLLEAETDSLLRSKASEIQYHYDGFDRLVKIDYPFSEDVTYEYGEAGQAGAGEIIRKKDESGDIRYEYGKLSEVIEETRTIKRYEALSEPETAVFTYRCDYLGRMQTMHYPDGETIIYTYDKGGQAAVPRAAIFIFKKRSKDCGFKSAFVAQVKSVLLEEPPPLAQNRKR